jgi:hypothetical protein
LPHTLSGSIVAAIWLLGAALVGLLLARRLAGEKSAALVRLSRPFVE